MLKDREGPSSDQESCNGPVLETAPAREGGGVDGEGGGEGEGQEEREVRWVLPEDRRKAVELLRKGEERVLRSCLEWVEVRRVGR